MFTQGRIRVLALFAADIVCIVAMWALTVFAYWMMGGSYTPSIYLRFWPVALAFAAVNALLGLYHGSWMYPAAPLPPVEEMRRLFLSSAITHFAVFTVMVLLYQTMQGYSRVIVAVSGVLTAVLAQSFRNWIRCLLMRLGIGQIPVLLAGSGETARRTAEILKDDAYTGFRIVGYFDGVRRQSPGLGNVDFPYLGPLKNIVRKARKRDIKVLIACQDERLFRCQMEEFSSWFTYIEYLPTARAFPIFGARTVSFGGLGGVEMVNQGRKKALRFQKRTLDTTLAILAFLLASPLFVVLPVLIVLTSRGGVFYRQRRLGMGGRSIRVWKFRSMYADADERLARLLAEDPEAAAEWRRSFKLRHDPRITPLGRFMRKTSLDELPQLFNVFAGEMSLIGPRPIVPAEVPYYGDSYNVFSSVRPGVTGLWQVSGRSDTDYTRRVALDAYYVLNWSPWMDIWILIRTFYAVALMRGAR